MRRALRYAAFYPLCLIAAALMFVGFLGCDGSPSSTAAAGAGGSGGGGGEGGEGGAPTLYALRVSVALTSDGQQVDVFAQNGTAAHVPVADLTGKTIWWATTPGGEPVSSATPLEFGSTVLGDDLTAEYATSAEYGDGPWEMSLFISIAGADPMNGPQPGDLASFDNSPPPEGQPPVTGSSVRMTVAGGDAHITLNNDYFVQF